MDDFQKLYDVAQEFLADSLARRVNGEFELGARKDHGGSKHGDGDGLSETTGSGNQNFLWQRVPSVEFEDFLVCATKRAFSIMLEKDPRTRSNVLVVKHFLVIGPIPP
jgi:hypothetical protein